MKFLLILILLGLFIAPTWAANCSINFENEVAANPLTHRLFSHIKENKAVLAQKGYKLPHF